MFDGIVIAANKGHHDLRSVTQQLLQELAGTYCTVARFEAHPRLLFPADTAKELIQIMYDSHFTTPYSRDITLDFLNGLKTLNHQPPERSNRSSSSNRAVFHSISRPLLSF